jgi:carbon monoxide dehydrogenase subunit G
VGDVTINNSTGAAAVNIQDGGNSITVDGSVTVSATDLDVRNLAKAQDEVYAVLRTDAGAAYDARQVTVQNSSLPVTDNAGSLTVDAPVATPVFVRLSDGAAAITTLPVSLATNTPTLQANSGVDVGDVTINNSTGAAAVNIQDGGNSITVDGSVTATLSAETTKVIGTVNVAASQTIATTNAGTFAVQQTTYATSSVTSVAGSASSVQLLASTAGRRGAYFYNDSTAIAYVKLGTTASTSSFTVAMAANSFYELPYPCYTGRIDCIWASAAGNMRITEIT